MANKTSQHILNTSANLLGFCLFVITSLHVANLTETHLMDELTSIIAVLLTLSCFFSFVSIRTTETKRGKLYESVAEYIFLVSLLGILIIILFITLHFIK
ncbi:MAG: hypothetical protein H6541_04070 [Lentimicrobiaceae bacterium]|nr:hypothetical protein [Lentimicrobiaceae bacterium]MCO5265813.1 hypothetical protein [Lentimicrobium sp.]